MIQEILEVFKAFQTTFNHLASWLLSFIKDIYVMAYNLPRMGAVAFEQLRIIFPTQVLAVLYVGLSFLILMRIIGRSDY